MALDVLAPERLPPRLRLRGGLAARRLTVRALNAEGRRYQHNYFSGFRFFPAEELAPAAPASLSVAAVLAPFAESKEGKMPWDDDGGANAHLAERQTWVMPAFRGLCESFFSSDAQTDPKRRDAAVGKMMPLELTPSSIAVLATAFDIDTALFPLLAVQSNRHTADFPGHVDRPHGAGFGAILTTYVVQGKATVALSPLLFPVPAKGSKQKAVVPRMEQELLRGTAYQLRHRARFCCTHAVEKVERRRVSLTLRFGVSPVMLSHLCTNQMARSPSLQWAGCHKDCCHRGDCVACHGLLFLPDI